MVPSTHCNAIVLDALPARATCAHWPWVCACGRSGAEHTRHSAYQPRRWAQGGASALARRRTRPRPGLGIVTGRTASADHQHGPRLYSHTPRGPHSGGGRGVQGRCRGEWAGVGGGGKGGCTLRRCVSHTRRPGNIQASQASARSSMSAMAGMRRDNHTNRTQLGPSQI
jgi:hypothetical protein